MSMIFNYFPTKIPQSSVYLRVLMFKQPTPGALFLRWLRLSAPYYYAFPLVVLLHFAVGVAVAIAPRSWFIPLVFVDALSIFLFLFEVIANASFKGKRYLSGPGNWMQIFVAMLSIVTLILSVVWTFVMEPHAVVWIVRASVSVSRGLFSVIQFNYIRSERSRFGALDIGTGAPYDWFDGAHPLEDDVDHSGAMPMGFNDNVLTPPVHPTEVSLQRKVVDSVGPYLVPVENHLLLARRLLPPPSPSPPHPSTPEAGDF